MHHANDFLKITTVLFLLDQLPGVHWWYKTASHAAELASGFHNSSNRDGYAPVISMLKKHATILNFTCVEMHIFNEHEEVLEAYADPDGLAWQVNSENCLIPSSHPIVIFQYLSLCPINSQVMNTAWDAGLHVASENSLPCYDRRAYNKILDIAKPFNHPDGQHLCTFNYLRLSPHLMEQNNLIEFNQFVKRMHGIGMSLKLFSSLLCLDQPSLVFVLFRTSCLFFYRRRNN